MNLEPRLRRALRNMIKTFDKSVADCVIKAGRAKSREKVAALFGAAEAYKGAAELARAKLKRYEAKKKKAAA